MLSRDQTVSSFWREAVRDLNSTEVLAFEKYLLCNRAVQTVSGQFYDLMSLSYMTDVVVNDATGSKYDTGTSGTYTALTHLVTLNSPSTNLSSGDIGKFVAFRIGTSIYFGKVFSAPSTILASKFLPKKFKLKTNFPNNE